MDGWPRRVTTLCLFLLVLAACGQDRDGGVLAPGIGPYKDPPREIAPPPSVVDAALSAASPRSSAGTVPATATPQPEAVVAVVSTATQTAPPPTPDTVPRPQRRVTQSIPAAKPTPTVVIPASQRAEQSVPTATATAVPTAAPPPHPTASPTLPATPTPGSGQVNEHPSVARARALAAQHLGLDDNRAHELTLDAWDAVTWSSAALGCTRAGFGYAAVQVPGYRIRFSHEGRRVSVHTNDKRPPHAIIPRNCLGNPDTAGRSRPHP